jgi:hypothetical protein
MRKASYSRAISTLSDSTTSWKDGFVTQYTSSLITYLDDDDKRRLEERRICCWVQDRCAGLERLEESADISAERKIVAEKNLLDLRDGSLLEYGPQTRLDIAALNNTRRVSS